MYDWFVVLTVGLVFIVNYLILRRISGVRLPWWWIGFAILLLVLVNRLTPLGYAFLWNPFILILLLQFSASKKSWLEATFYGLYAWGVTDLITKFLSFIVFPLVMGYDLTTSPLSLPFLLISSLLAYPIYLLVHHFIDFEYLTVEGDKALGKQSQTMLIGVTISFGVYGFILSVLAYVSSLAPTFLFPNYLPLIVLLAIGFFFAMISYVNRRLKDQLFRELQEEQERHFQSLREANQHILSLHRELARGVPQLQGDQVTGEGEQVDLFFMGSEGLPLKRILPDISNIPSQLLQSVIESKFEEAKAKGVTLILEAPDRLPEPTIDAVDLSLVLQVFLDTGLVVADREDANAVRLILEQENGTWKLVVEVAASQEVTVFIAGDERQVSLHQLESIVQGYPQAKVTITYEKNMLIQMLEC